MDIHARFVFQGRRKCSQHSVPTLAILLKFPKPKSGVDVNQSDTNGKQSVDVGSLGRKSEIVDCLLKNGAQPKHDWKVQDTPLHIAATRGHTAIVQVTNSKSCFWISEEPSCLWPCREVEDIESANPLQRQLLEVTQKLSSFTSLNMIWSINCLRC